jgi:uncharacterized OB-fold protein
LDVAEANLATPDDFVPAVPHIRIDPAGGHALAGTRCGACGNVFEGERLACPACGARDSLEALHLARAGRIAAHTVVHRSLPGVEVPFVSVVVDLDRGGSVRGKLTGVDPLGDLSGEQRVAMVFRGTGQRDHSGKPFLCYYFVPEGSAAA